MNREVGQEELDHPVHDTSAKWDDEDKDSRKTSLCCLQGCLAASAVGFSFFVALPTGIILVVLSVNNDESALLAVGCVLISLPLLMLIVVIILCLNQKRLCCNKPSKKNAIHQPVKTQQIIHTTGQSGEHPV